jgi:hypothetical protein
MHFCERGKMLLKNWEHNLILVDGPSFEAEENCNSHVEELQE